MEKNKDYEMQTASETVEKRYKTFISDFIAGICVGVAFIIPGFSGGSVAAILGIYEKMINAIANVFKEFKRSVLTLLPVGVGMIVGAGALLFPLGYFLSIYPLATVSLFVGLAIGGIPSMLSRVKGKVTTNDVIALSISIAAALMICFIPAGGDVSLFDLNVGGFILLFLVGMLGSCALVVPGISGSMLLLILGYYKPILSIFTEHLLLFKDVWYSILIIGVCGAGMAVGFLLISIAMKFFLGKYPRTTYFSIIGFIVGSLPAAYISTMRDAGMISGSFTPISVPTAPINYMAYLFFIIMGVGVSYGVSTLVDRKSE